MSFIDSFSGMAAALGLAVVALAGSACDLGSATPPPPATTMVPPPAATPPLPHVSEPSSHPPSDEEATSEAPNSEGRAPGDSTSAPGEYVPYEPEQPGAEQQEFQEFKQDTGYPYSYEEHDQLPGYQQCGTACGQESTSGETQRQWLCQQGMLTEGC